MTRGNPFSPNLYQGNQVPDRIDKRKKTSSSTEDKKNKVDKNQKFSWDVIALLVEIYFFEINAQSFKKMTGSYWLVFPCLIRIGRDQIVLYWIFDTSFKFTSAPNRLH